MKTKLTPEQQEHQRLEMEKRDAKLKTYLKTGHTIPTTRREFIGSGLMAGLSTMALPSILQMIGREAQASELSAECVGVLQPQGTWIPYVQVAFGGGAALHTSLLQLDSARNLLPSYSAIGLGTVSNFNVTHEFGNVPFAQQGGKYVGQVMQGLTDVAGPATLANTAMVKFAVPSQDDRVNPDGILGLVMAAGRRGIDLPALSTPLTQKTAAFQRATALQGVNDVNAFMNALVPQGKISTYIQDPTKRLSLLRLVNSLSASQRKTLDTSSSSQTLGQLMECATGKNIDMAQTNTSQYDPRTNAAVAAVWGINTSSAPGLREVLHATVVMNALNGKAGGARIDLSGYDYHGDMRVNQNSLDLDGGQILGRILKTASVMQQPVFLHVTSDGSVETHSDTSTSDFGADAGARGTGCFLVYNPKARPVTTDTQIGQFNTSQAADVTFVNTWTVDRCALAVFANYLQVHKQIGMLQTLAPNQFDSDALKKLVKLA